MIVVDTSALISVLAERPLIEPLRTRLVADDDLHAPYLVDVEILNSLRGLVARGTISLDRATDARADYANMLITRYPHQPLADRIWELRENISAYDAAFVALAEALGCPLITCDARLGRAANHAAQIEVFSPA